MTWQNSSVIYIGSDDFVQRKQSIVNLYESGRLKGPDGLLWRHLYFAYKNKSTIQMLSYSHFDLN